MSMKSKDIIMMEKAQAEAGAQAKEQERQQSQQTYTAAAKGEHLTDDFEPVASDAGRTFSQDEVNGFIRDRLAKERAKYSASSAAMAEKLTGYETALTEREKQLAAAEHRHKAEKALRNLGINADDNVLNLVMGANLDETIQKIGGYWNATKQNPGESLVEINTETLQPVIATLDPKSIKVNSLKATEGEKITLRKIMGINPK